MKPSAVAELFADRRTLRAVVDSVLEGRLGTVFADDPGAPRVARLEVGSYSIFGGDASAPAAREMVREVRAPREILFPDSDSWRRLLAAEHGPRLSERPMRGFDAGGLDPSRLAGIAAEVPAGFTVTRIDAAMASRLDSDLEPHALRVFRSPAEFAEHGIGFCARQGDALACAATSYTISSRAIELAIATHPGYRRKGLAQVVAAALMHHCLERGLVPHWNAANPVSERLAVRLGYRPSLVCEILYLAGDQRPGTSGSLRP